MIKKLDKMILDYQIKYGVNPKAILVTEEQMLRIRMEMAKGLYFGLEVRDIFPNANITKYKGIDVMLKEEVIEL